DLGTYVAGLRLEKLDIAAPRADQPAQASAAGKLADAPLTLDAKLGAPAAFLPGKPAAAFPVDFSLQAAGAHLAIKGAIAHPDGLAGVALALSVEIANLAALS